LDAAVSHAELRLHIERIVGCLEFQDSPRHRQLLRYLADHAIATGGRSVSPQEIHADVLCRSAGGRGEALTPALVVVDDLRRKLERYAAAAGRGDAVRISIPLNECRLTATRPEVKITTAHKRHLPGTPRPVVMVIEFDAEPVVRSLAKPLAEAMVEKLMDHAAFSVIAPVSRQQVAGQYLAVEDAPAAWDADAGVHGMLMSLPGEQNLQASIGASTRLFSREGAVVWTLWCEEPLTPAGSDEALILMAEKIAGFVADGLQVGRKPS